jgi:hypothetical protein
MKSFMTTFSTGNARRLQFGMAGLALVIVAIMAGISLMRISLSSPSFPQVIPAIGADIYVPLDQHERHAITIGSAIASPMLYANRDLWYAEASASIPLDQHERHAISANIYPPLDQHERHVTSTDIFTPLDQHERH